MDEHHHKLTFGTDLSPSYSRGDSDYFFQVDTDFEKP